MTDAELRDVAVAKLTVAYQRAHRTTQGYVKNPDEKETS